MTARMIATTGIAWMALSSSAQAFPELVRHHYVNCTSCHYSVIGGGILNDYGRQGSKAVLSHGKFFFEPSGDGAQPKAGKDAKEGKDGKKEDVLEVDENDPEVKFLYGGVAEPDWLRLGGDIRFLQLFQNTPTFNEGRFITMQADLEAAATVGKLTLVASAGRQDATVQNPTVGDYFVSHRHYVNFQATDEIVLTAGKYGKPYGINTPYHSTFIRESLGWDIGIDTWDSYNAQLSYLGDTYNFMVAWDFGRPDNVLTLEHGPVLTVSRAFSDTYKVGASYSYGMTDQGNRHVFGPWAILGFTEHFYLDSENDFVSAQASATQPATFGFTNYNRLGYELTQGFHVFGVQEFIQSDFNNDKTRGQGYGAGILYYPRPHWEFEAFYEKKRVNQQYDSFYDVAWLYLHFYP